MGGEGGIGRVGVAGMGGGVLGGQGWVDGVTGEKSCRRVSSGRVLEHT